MQTSPLRPSENWGESPLVSGRHHSDPLAWCWSAFDWPAIQLHRM